MLRATDEALDSADGSSRDEQSIAETGGRVIDRWMFRSEFADGKFMAASLEISRVEIFNCNKMAFNDVALNKVSFVDFFCYVPPGRPSINSFVVLLIYLAEACSIQQSICLEEFETTIEFL